MLILKSRLFLVLLFPVLVSCATHQQPESLSYDKYIDGWFRTKKPSVEQFNEDVEACLNLDPQSVLVKKIDAKLFECMNAKGYDTSSAGLNYFASKRLVSFTNECREFPQDTQQFSECYVEKSVKLCAWFVPHATALTEEHKVSIITQCTKRLLEVSAENSAHIENASINDISSNYALANPVLFASDLQRQLQAYGGYPSTNDHKTSESSSNDPLTNFSGQGI